MRSKIYFLAILLFLFACGTEDPEGDDPKDGDTKGGESTCLNSDSDLYYSIQQGSEQREYLMHIPDFSAIDHRAPVIINFHGFGGCASNFYEDIGAGNSGLNFVTASKDAIVVYPQGIERSKGDTEWYPGDSGIENIMENDVYFVERIIEDIKTHIAIDTSRIYAVGYSNGGMMAYGLACNSSDKIAAVGIMSGVMLEDVCDLNATTSIIHFHGIEDDVLPFNGNQNFQAVPDIIDFWLDHNNIPSASLTSNELNNGNVVHDLYTGGNDNSAVSLYTVYEEYDKPGGHVWFTDAIDGQTPNDILLDFLFQFQLD